MSTIDSQVDATAPISKDQAAERLAREYMELDSSLLKVIRIVDPARESDPGEPIKLLEIYQHAIPSGVILPLGFPAHPQSGLFYPTEIVQIAPDDLPRVRARAISLPDGWELGPEFDRDSPDDSSAR